MFLWLWIILRGYVAVEITGLSTERFLNLTAHKGVYIWNVRKTAGGIQMHCSIKGFRMLKNFARKTNSRIRIAGRYGLPFVLHRYRKRKILMGGVLFFVAALFLLASFVWRIDIEGTDRICPEEVRVFLAQNGLALGTFKHTIDHGMLNLRLAAHFPQIGWVDVHTRGTRTTVLISETTGTSPVVTASGEPTNIIARKGGLITGIVTGAGLPQVRQNDVVQPGALLVSGQIPITLEHTGETFFHYVSAYAEVWALDYTTIRFGVPLTYSYKEHTGQTTARHTIRLVGGNGFALNLFHTAIPYTGYDRIVSHRQPGLGENYPLPFIITTAIYNEFRSVRRERSPQEAKQLAEQIITARIINEFDYAADIIGREVTFEEVPGRVFVTAVITTNRRIDMAVPIGENQ